MEASHSQRAFWEMFTGISLWVLLDVNDDKLIIHFYIYWSRYSVADRRWTQMLTSSVEESSVPLPRYHHASALVYNHDPFSGSQAATHSLMFVVGGVTKKGVANDTWCLNLSSLVWKQYKVLHVEYPALIHAPRLLFSGVKCLSDSDFCF